MTMILHLNIIVNTTLMHALTFTGYSESSRPNKLTTAIGAGPPSLAFVCPQYAMMYFEGCQVTVGEGARAGTR
jgi:hypothetical protein